MTETLEQVWELFRERTGFAGQSIGRVNLESGAFRAMERAGLTDLPSYLARLRADPTAMDDFVEELVIGESYFFREPQQWRLLSREILPELARRRGAEQTLRLWSAGCASGEEAYTLAVLLTEAGVGNAHILATDISRAALARARRARYRRWSLREIADGDVGRYFTRQGTEYELRSSFCSRVTFDELNLVNGAYPSLTSGVWGVDLALCRNVLIYFDRDTVAAVGRRLYQSLAPGGWLITGSSDPPLQEIAPYEVVIRPEGVFYRRPPQETRMLLPAPASIPIPASEPAVALAPSDPGETDGWAERVRARANRQDSRRAIAICREGLALQPLSTELRYLLAVLLLAEGRAEEAQVEAGKVLYLDRRLVVGHLLAGVLSQRLGDLPAARRAFRTARRLTDDRPDDEPAPLGEGATVGELRGAASAQLAALDAGGQVERQA